MAIIEPFDFKKIFMITLAGSPEIFAFISLIFLAGLSAYFNMPSFVFLILVGLFGVVMSAYVGGLYLLIILIAGLLAFYGIKKIIGGT